MRIYQLLPLAVVITVLGVAASADDARLGLCVERGVLMREGTPYRGVGANYFSLFSRLLKNADDPSSLANLTALGKAGIPFVRFMCGGFWPAEQQLYLTDRAAYFARLDRVVHAAEQSGIGLIPSLFWNLPTVPDVVGEHLDQLGNPSSKSIAFIRCYTEEVVERYKDSPAIWGWECGNEYNLAADLPNARQHRPHVAPKLGTPTERSAQDEVKFSQLRTALVAFAETVRRHDPARIILSGNSMPRPAAWHNAHEKSWTSDTETQFGEILLRDNPEPIDTLCVHLYPNEKSSYAGGAKSIGEAIALAMQQARQSGKPLVIGEFGVPRQWGPRPQQQATFAEFLEAFDKQGVPLAAFWVFDLEQQEKDGNVSFANDRAYMIELVAKLNRELQQGSESRKAEKTKGRNR